MEKIFQILIVFALLVFAITWFMRGKDRRYREYAFSGRFTFPLSGDMHRDLLTAMVIRPGEERGPAVDSQEQGAAADMENQLLFRRGDGKILEIIDEVNNVITGTIALDWDADVVLFDPGTRLIFCGSVEGAVTIIRPSTQGIYKIVQRLAVPKDYTALSVDPHNGKLYVHVGAEVSVFANV
jgi:hypothetical protein